VTCRSARHCRLQTKLFLFWLTVGSFFGKAAASLAGTFGISPRLKRGRARVARVRSLDTAIRWMFKYLFIFHVKLETVTAAPKLRGRGTILCRSSSLST